MPPAARPGANVFEYGSGASTVWLARRGAQIRSIEHHDAWFTLMQTRIERYSKIDLTLVPQDSKMSKDPLFHSQKEGYLGTSFEAYVRAISRAVKTYDLIVIDGRARAACLSVAAQHLAKDGLIVFDNSKRQRYMDAIRASAFEATHLPGLTPALPYPDQTTLLRAHPKGERV